MKRIKIDRKSCLSTMNIILSWVTLLCTSCIKIPDEEVRITLSVSNDSINFSFAGASHTFNVSSNDSWYVGKEASWLTVSPFYGYNVEEVTVTADRNTSFSSRNATIIVRSSVSGVSSQNITVTQAGATTYAQVRFRKDGAYPDDTYMGVVNSSGNLVAYYYFGSSSGTSNYYSVTAGAYRPTFYNVNYGWQYFYYYDSSIYTVFLEAGYRYTFSLFSDNGRIIENDGVF